MLEISRVILTKAAALVDIPRILSQVYEYNLETSSVAETLEVYLDVFKDNIFIYIEYPYVDKFYRNSYYTYFASKHHLYPRDCIRLSFFDKEISDTDFRSIETTASLQESFLGFLVLRPTFPVIIGRSVINPKALKDGNFSCCMMQASVMVNGVRLEVWGYPHSTQDTETITCAETTIWNVMEYFGNKYPEYRPVLPSEIIEVLAGYSYERQLPSKGLQVTHISYALKKFGFGVRNYSAEAHEINFKRIFNYYVDSGIPVIVALRNDNLRHAVVYIGYETLSTDNLKNAITSSIPAFKLRQDSLKIIEFADFDKKHIVIDDNYPPYQKADFSLPTAYYSDPRFADCKPVFLIVPLSQRIHLEVLEARKLVEILLNNSDMGHPGADELILRLFLTSSRAYKISAAVDEKMDSHLQELIIHATMPRFIWVAELFTKQSLVNKECTGVILIDATSANADLDSLILITYPDVIITHQSGQVTKLDLQTSPFNMHISNLKRTS